MITQSINLNLIPGAVPPRIKVSQYDFGSRTLQFTLFNGTSPFTTASLTARIQGTKPDNKGFSYDATYNAGVVTADVTRQMTACAGAVTCELVIVDGSNNELGTGNFILDVEPSALSEDTDISDTEIPAIIDAAETNAERAEDAADRAEAASANPPYIGENEHWYVWDTSTEQYVDSGVDAEGVDGVGIVSIAKTGTVGLVDTYTITLSNGQTQTFTVTNGAAAVLPAGGTAQQVLMKNSSTDSDASWKDINITASYKDMQAALGAPAGAGKNLLKNTASTTTKNGVTFTVNASDKTTTADSAGSSASADAKLELMIAHAADIPAGDYILSQFATGSADYNLYINAYNNDTFVRVLVNTANSESKNFSIDYSNYNELRIGIIILSGKTVSNVLFKPMIRPAGTSADYVPHSDSLQAQVEAKAEQTALAPVENGATASRAYNVGAHFVRDGAFCTCIVAIASGGSFTLNTNYIVDAVCNKIGDGYYTCTTTDYEDTGIEFTVNATTFVCASLFFNNAVPKGIKIYKKGSITTPKAAEESSIATGQLSVIALLEPATYVIYGKWQTANTNNRIWYKILT